MYLELGEVSTKILSVEKALISLHWHMSLSSSSLSTVGI